jgi:ketosteroid isomerase-like protein
MRPAHLLLLLALAVFATDAGAQGVLGAAAPPSLSQTLPSVTLPAALDRVLRDYEAAWRRGDAAALAALFAEDGFVLQGGRAPVRGRAAIQAAYAGQGGAKLRLRALAASVADTVGFIIGAYGYGDAAVDQGKFTLTLRRRPGGPWLIFSDMDNTIPQPR